jgi:hypothetical protein
MNDEIRKFLTLLLLLSASILLAQCNPRHSRSEDQVREIDDFASKMKSESILLFSKTSDAEIIDHWRSTGSGGGVRGWVCQY